MPENQKVRSVYQILNDHIQLRHSCTVSNFSSLFMNIITPGNGAPIAGNTVKGSIAGVVVVVVVVVRPYTMCCTE
jgi:hypothetical protein